MDDDTVERFFTALEAGDTDTMATIYAPDARIWHNDYSEQGVTFLSRVKLSLPSETYPGEPRLSLKSAGGRESRR